MLLPPPTPTCCRPGEREALLIDPVFEQSTRDLSLLHELGLTLKLVVSTPTPTPTTSPPPGC
ncbi:hypothetical protein ULF88_10910 [Halopseudomonas pachastrellae]|nr:hypothetical protein [Halopseudomonas pachastrellae]